LSRAGVVAALSLEARAFGARRRWRPGIEILPDGTLLTVSGMGLASASAAARALVAAGATGLVSCGVAGGLDPQWRAGAVMLPQEVLSVSGARLPTTTRWHERVHASISAALRSASPLSHAPLLTSPVAIETPAQKIAAFRGSGAVAVDMESLAVGEVARQFGLSFLVIRVVIDAAHDVLPAGLAAAANAGGRLRGSGQLARHLLVPGELRAWWQFARRFRAANASLSSAARAADLTASLP